MSAYDFITSALSMPSDAIAYTVGVQLSEMYPDSALVEGWVCLFNVDEYAKAGHCMIEYRRDVHDHFLAEWTSEKGVLYEPENCWRRIFWRGKCFETLVLTWHSSCHPRKHFWIIAEVQAEAEAFFSAVSEWNSEVREEVLVFDDGCWNKDEAPFQEIRSSTLENLVLEGTLKRQIHDDLTQFFSSRDEFEGYGIPWKRGVLFIGPPGNGKTHAVKALVNAIGKPCLYVKSVQTDYQSQHESIRQVFVKARASAPCFVVLEDLDSLVNDGNRAYFLNELDGFASNCGVVVLATTNHPDKLDASIVDRPSRFDRKYHFNLPSRGVRLAYLKQWACPLVPALKPGEEAIAAAAAASEGFSFAYLKELFVSSLMRWSAAGRRLSMDCILVEQVELLKSQMSSATTNPSRANTAE